MWRTVSIVIDAARAETFSESLLEQGALSVSIEDAQAGSEREEARYGEPGTPPAEWWPQSRVEALLGETADLAAMLAHAMRAAGLDDLPPVSTGELAEQDWVRLTQSQFAPIRINEQLWIVPSWHEAPPSGSIHLVLDPGLAFGTGSHPTTHLCLDWLCGEVDAGDRVLDYGCGSGILAIAAARLGASAVTAVDIDPGALQATGDNARVNDVALRIRHSGAPLEETFDIVVANILTNPLCVLAPLLIERLRPGGRLALSGILQTQIEQVQAAYRPALELVCQAERDGWVLLSGTRPC